MIYFINGKVYVKEKDFFVINANDIGFKIFAHKKILDSLKIGNEYLIFTYFHLKENAVELYGFLEEKELSFFEILNSVSGVGPKSALSILEKNDIKTLSLAIKNNKIEFLTRASGIGQKTAERIILELKNKIDLEGNQDASHLDSDADIIEALTNLGYSKQRAKEAVSKVDSEIQGFEERFKHALKNLNKK